MKRLASMFLSIAMVLSLTVAASAATGEYTFSVEVNDTSVTIGDTVTVTMTLTKTDGASYDLYGMQDYIGFDSDYFTYVDDSISVATTTTNGFSVDMFQASPIKDLTTGIYHSVYVNRTETTAYVTEADEEIQVVTFQLEAIKAGTTEISQYGIEMLTRYAVNQTVNSNSATVTITSTVVEEEDDDVIVDDEDNDDSSSSSGSSGSSGSSSSSSDVSYDVDIDTPTTSDTTATIEFEGSVSDGVLTADLDVEHIEYAIELALDEADSSDDISVIVYITSDDDFDGFSLNLPLEVQEMILDNNISFFILATDNVEIYIDYDAIYTINDEVEDDVQVTVYRANVDADIVGDRPAYSFDISNDDVTVSHFGDGTITIGIPYTLASGEDAEDILVVYIDADGNVTKVAGSYYDTDTGLAMATVSHFSIYAVGYDESWNSGFLFDDVQDSTAYYYDAVYWAVTNGITTGTSDTTFSPNATCTRAQAVTFLWRAAGEPIVEGDCPFTDVASDAYYYQAVLWAVANGITVGTSDTTFSPNDNCTRSQIVTFLWRSADEPIVDSTNPFADVTTTSYYYDAVLWAVSEEITTGTSTTAFSPSNDCTRGQIVTFLYRYLGD